MDTKIKSKKRYSLGEEIFNSISHGIGAVFGIAATAVMLVWAVMFGDTIGVVSAAIYGATLIIMYTMSTLYHAFTSERVKRIFQIFDHCSIFLLIAGTYTPICLTGLGGQVGWTVFGIVWGCAVFGIVISSVKVKRWSHVVSVILYLIMGWMVVFTLRPVIELLGGRGFVLLLTGGALYTIGIIFYLLKKVAYMHSVWHLFVLGGSVLHFLCVLLYIIPVR